jgi:hypothetical protein
MMPLALRSFSRSSSGIFSDGFEHLGALIADLGEGEAVEGGDFGCEALEDVFDRVDAIRAAEGDDEVAEDFPGIRALPGALTALVEALEAAGDVDHAAALFGVGGAGEDDVAQFGAGVGQKVQSGDEGHFFEVALREADFEQILAEGQNAAKEATGHLFL